ncbi:MAG: motif family protein [Thermoanaerobaculia bacterium]|nr:motif family protein [Thermoanaerobaculia bacterium]
MSSNTRTAAVVVVIVAFAAGILVGVAGDHLYLIRSGRLFPRHTSRFAADRMAEHLRRELQLTPQQKTQVQQIIEKHRAKIDAMMSNVRPQVRAELDATNKEIETILTPEQKTKFADLRMRVGNRRRDRGSTTRQ